MYSQTSGLALVPTQSCVENPNEDIVIISGDAGWTCCSCSLDFGPDVSVKKHLADVHKAEAAATSEKMLSPELEGIREEDFEDGVLTADKNNILLSAFNNRETIQIIKNDYSASSPSISDETGEESFGTVKRKNTVEVKIEAPEEESFLVTTIPGSSYTSTQIPRPVAVRVNDSSFVETCSEAEESDMDKEEKVKKQHKLFDLIGRAAAYFKDINSREALILLTTSLVALEYKNAKCRGRGTAAAESVTSVALTYQKTNKKTDAQEKKKAFICKICNKAVFGYTSEALLWHCKTHFIKRATVLQCKFCTKTFRYKQWYESHMRQAHPSNDEASNTDSEVSSMEQFSANSDLISLSKEEGLSKLNMHKKIKSSELQGEKDQDDRDHSYFKISVDTSKSLAISDSSVLDGPSETLQTEKESFTAKAVSTVGEELAVDISNGREKTSMRMSQKSQEARVKCVICGVLILKRPSLCKRHYGVHLQKVTTCPVCHKSIPHPNYLRAHVYEHQLALCEPHNTVQVNMSTSSETSKLQRHIKTSQLNSEKSTLSMNDNETPIHRQSSSVGKNQNTVVGERKNSKRTAAVIGENVKNDNETPIHCQSSSVGKNQNTVVGERKNSKRTVAVIGENVKNNNETPIHCQSSSVGKNQNTVVGERKNSKRTVAVIGENVKSTMVVAERKNNKNIAERVNCVVCGQAFISCDSTLLRHYNFHVNCTKSCPVCLEKIPNKDRLKLHILQHQRELTDNLDVPLDTLASNHLSFTWDSSNSLIGEQHKSSESMTDEQCQTSDSALRKKLKYTAKGSSKYSDSFIKEHAKEIEESSLEIQNHPLGYQDFSLETTTSSPTIKPVQEQNPHVKTGLFSIVRSSTAVKQHSEIKAKYLKSPNPIKMKRKGMSERRARCIICGLIYRTRRSALLAHYSVHVRKRTTCPLCNIEILHKVELKEHIYEHQKERNPSLLLPASLIQGPVFVHNKQVCVLCGDFFSQHGHDRQSHIKMHFQEKTSCSVCDEIFHDEETFVKHILHHQQGIHDTSDLDSTDAIALWSQSPKSDTVQLSNQEGSMLCSEKDLTVMPVSENDVQINMTIENQDQVELDLESNPISMVGNFDNKKSSSLQATNYLHPNLQEKKVRCSVCKLDLLDDMKSLEQHSIQHPEKTHLECVSCSKKFDSVQSLMSHMKNHTKDKWKFACRLCSAAYRSPMEYRQHRRACWFVECNAKTTVPTNASGDGPSERLEQHAASHSHGGVCEVCGTTLQTKKGLEQHRLLHTGGVGHYPCTRCNKAFLYEVRLKRHMEKHNNVDSIFTCEYCGKTYMNRTPLLHHIAINHENSKESVFLYKCDQCPAMYSFPSELRDHMAFRHKGLTLYTCKYCNQGFNCRPTLVRHERVQHTKFFPHKCGECEEAFAEKVKLVSHQIRVHKAVTPFRCNECGTSCTTAGALRHHMLIHDEKRPRPFKCEPCNVAYFDKYHLDRHLKRGKCKPSVYCVVVVEPVNQDTQL
ncbi:hypothetical protein C0Q70_19297 [Pomacea canaliculata]|uniref:C2H2-type domain-containing protein n=1 Tax=Pomacea canaliculata TaxID=400727 RepID=A0A2T7NIX6_POMCA|nr:hypothetical protein C0Q70_19297 [Pomacea canaliculata]